MEQLYLPIGGSNDSEEMDNSPFVDAFPIGKRGFFSQSSYSVRSLDSNN